jgi:hypothetical protein
MTDTAIRLSETEVQAAGSVFTFAASADADAFQQCLVAEDAARCCAHHPPVSARPVHKDKDAPGDDPDRGSTISPSTGAGFL